MTMERDEAKIRLAQDLYAVGDDLLEELKNRREQLGLSAEELSERLNEDRDYITRLENGEEDLVATLTDICFQLGVYIQYELRPMESETRPMSVVTERMNPGMVRLEHEGGQSEVFMIPISPEPVTNAEVWDTESGKATRLTTKNGVDLMMEVSQA